MLAIFVDVNNVRVELRTKDFPWCDKIFNSSRFKTSLRKGLVVVPFYEHNTTVVFIGVVGGHSAYETLRFPDVSLIRTCGEPGGVARLETVNSSLDFYMFWITNAPCGSDPSGWIDSMKGVSVLHYIYALHNVVMLELFSFI
jgi:hypothetical protein